jgi:hypothetical protein
MLDHALAVRLPRAIREKSPPHQSKTPVTSRGFFMEKTMELSLERRMAEISEIMRAYEREDLRGAEFQRQLRLAHSEGLLAELLQNSGLLDRQGQFRTASSVRLAELGNRSSASPLRGQDYPRIAFLPSYRLSLSRLASSLLSLVKWLRTN